MPSQVVKYQARGTLRLGALPLARRYPPCRLKKLAKRSFLHVMAPAAVPQSLQLFVVGLRGTPAGNEVALINNVRARLNGKYPNMDRVEVLQNIFLHGTEPLLQYLAVSIGKEQCKSFSRTDLGNYVFRLFELISARTRLRKKFFLVTDSAEAWSAVEAGLQMALAGQPVGPPEGHEEFDAPRAWQPVVASPWWASRGMVSLFFLAVSVGVYQCRYFYTLGRSRLQVAFASLVTFFAAVAYYGYGPRYLPQSITRVFAVGVGLDDADDAEVESLASEASEPDPSTPARRVSLSEPSTPAQPTPEFAQISSELAELRDLVKTLASNSPAPLPEGVPPMPGGSAVPSWPDPSAMPASASTLMDFANNMPPSGTTAGPTPISLSSHLPQATPTAVPTSSTPWSPSLSASRASEQAGTVVNLLNKWKGTRATNPFWGAAFWHDVAHLEAERALEPDVQRALRSHGYMGQSTEAGAPRDDLAPLLIGIRDSGAPPVGAGLASLTVPTTVPMPGAATGQDMRWEAVLPPDLPRAAPQIYRAIRSEGCANVREWLQSRYKGDKSNKNSEWTLLWNAASEVDFGIARAPPGQEAAYLVGSDGDEIRLRSLAAHVHFVRSGDVNSATHMLAIKPPGTSTDVAPEWLVESASKFSTHEYSRAQRVRSSSANPKGGGRGRGRGGGQGQGGGRGDGAGDGAPRGRGRGR